VDGQGRVNLSAINLDKPFDAAMARRQDDGRGGGGDRGGRGGDRDRGGRGGGFGGDRGGRGGFDRGPRPDAPAPEAAPAPEEDDETPRARFRPRR